MVALLLAMIWLGATADKSEAYRVVHASQILALIERNESLDYANVVIEGDLDISRTNLSQRIIASQIAFKNSRILGMVSFNDSVLMAPVRFQGVEFRGPAYFVHSEFQQGADFSESSFLDKALFRKSLINHTGDFAEAKFQGLADFGSASFDGENAVFRGTRFNGSAIFVAARFGVDDANFEWSQFAAPAKFWHAVFDNGANFRGAQFGDSIDLQSAQFNGTADFFGAEFQRDVYFNDVKFETFIAQWPSIADKLNCNGPPYLQLIKNFKELEQFEDADSCYYQYRNWKRDIRPFSWPKVFDYLAWLSCGYGVRWQNPILSGVLVALLFGLYFESWDIGRFFWSGLRSGSMKYNYEFRKRMKVSIAFSAATLLSLPSDWYPFGKDEYSRILKMHLCSSILERMIGWGLMLLLIGTLSRLMVRY